MLGNGDFLEQGSPRISAKIRAKLRRQVALMVAINHFFKGITHVVTYERLMHCTKTNSNTKKSFTTTFSTADHNGIFPPAFKPLSHQHKLQHHLLPPHRWIPLPPPPPWIASSNPSHSSIPRDIFCVPRSSSGSCATSRDEGSPVRPHPTGDECIEVPRRWRTSRQSCDGPCPPSIICTASCHLNRDEERYIVSEAETPTGSRTPVTHPCSSPTSECVRECVGTFHCDGIES